MTKWGLFITAMERYCSTAPRRHRKRHMIPERRRIREDEAAVIRAALERAPVMSVIEAARNAVDNLEVIARCECGCATVDFDAPTAGERSSPIADGIAT